MMKELLYGAIMMAVTLPVHAGSPYLSKVYDYCPAPGQFVNVLPEYEAGDTHEIMLEKVAEQLCGEESPGMISLGGFGGYVVVGFDHPVVNVEDEYDFKLLGNAFAAESASAGGSCEPGAVMVSVDANGNGIPDDEWFELAGSEYAKESTKKDFRITYYKPDDGKESDPDPSNSAITDRTYIHWITNYSDESEGYIQKNAFHTQPYFPQWLAENEYTLTGTRIANNAELRNGSYFLSFMDYGYVDNRPSASDPGFMIDWAVDADGNPVHLPHIDFIKVYTAVNQQCGWIGETSTELRGGEDLHPEAAVESVVAASSRFRLSCRGNCLDVTVSTPSKLMIYAISGVIVDSYSLSEGRNGIDVSKLPKGVYVAAISGATARFVK